MVIAVDLLQGFNCTEQVLLLEDHADCHLHRSSPLQGSSDRVGKVLNSEPISWKARGGEKVDDVIGCRQHFILNSILS